MCFDAGCPVPGHLCPLRSSYVGLASEETLTWWRSKRSRLRIGSIRRVTYQPSFHPITIETIWIESLVLKPQLSSETYIQYVGHRLRSQIVGSALIQLRGAASCSGSTKQAGAVLGTVRHAPSIPSSPAAWGAA